MQISLRQLQVKLVNLGTKLHFAGVRCNELPLEVKLRLSHLTQILVVALLRRHERRSELETLPGHILVLSVTLVLLLVNFNLSLILCEFKIQHRQLRLTATFHRLHLLLELLYLSIFIQNLLTLRIHFVT